MRITVTRTLGSPSMQKYLGVENRSNGTPPFARGVIGDLGDFASCLQGASLAPVEERRAKSSNSAGWDSKASSSMAATRSGRVSRTQVLTASGSAATCDVQHCCGMARYGSWAEAKNERIDATFLYIARPCGEPDCAVRLSRLHTLPACAACPR